MKIDPYQIAKLITEDVDEYGGLEDADEFAEEGSGWQQDNWGPVTVGEYTFKMYTLYQAESRDIDSIAIYRVVDPDAYGRGNEVNLRDHQESKAELHKIKAAILSEYPEYQRTFRPIDPTTRRRYAAGTDDQLLYKLILADNVQEAIQDICFKGDSHTVEPNMELFQQYPGV